VSAGEEGEEKKSDKHLGKDERDTVTTDSLKDPEAKKEESEA
jgi:hypothetical protein